MIDVRKIFRDRKGNIDVGIPAFNINAMSSSLQKKKALAEAALARTAYGKGGVIRVDIDQQANKIVYVQTITGQIADTIEEAADLADETSIADVKVFGRRKSFGPSGGLASAMETAEALKNQYGAGAVLGESVLDKLRNLDPVKKQMLIDNGIDINDLSNFEMRVYTMSKQKNVGDLVRKIRSMQKDGTIGGIIMPDDEGARVLGFVNNGTALNTYQTNLILDVTGHNFFDQADMMDALRSGDPAKLSKMVEKSPKRARAFVSSNEISLSGEALESVVSAFRPGTKAIEDLTLVLDPQYEILRRFADRTYMFDDLENSTGLTAYYRGMDALKEVRNINKGFAGSRLADSELSELAGHIRNFTKDAGSNKWASQQLMEYLESNFIGTDSRKGAAVRGIFESIEKSYDGADALNKRFIDTYVAGLQSQIDEINNQLGSTSDAHQKQMALAMKEDLSDKIKRVRNGDYTQVTGRGRTTFGGRNLNIKNAFGAPGEFKTGLEDYGMIISRFSLKSEVGLAGGESSFILSGIGQKGTTVYADPVSVMFNAEIFTNPESLDIIQKNQAEVIEGFRQSIDSGVVPSKLRRMLEMQASMNIDELSASKRLSGARNKEFAQSILDLLNSGASVKDNPTLVSMLHKSFATMAFTEKQYANGYSFFEPALPETQRFALNTERSLQAFEENRNIYNKLGESASGRGGYQSIDFANGVSSEVIKFRIQGHAALLPNVGVGEFYHSLGGFDLDDKGLVRTVTYKDAQGNNRLGSYMFRQPSGPEELIFMKANMDVETIQGLFGNDIYRRQISSMIETQMDEIDSIQQRITGMTGAARTAEEATLQEANKRLRNLNFAETVIAENGPVRSTAKIADQDAIESIFADAARGIGNAYELTDDAMAKIGTDGSSTLRLTDLIDPRTGKSVIPGYSKPGVAKAFLDNKALQMGDDILEVINSNNVDAGLKQALSQPGLSFEDMMRTLGSYADSGSSEANAVISTALNNMITKRLEQSAGNLGTYVNRTGMATSVLDQYSAFLKSASSEVRSYLLDENNINYRMLMIPQESAIDLSVNVSTAKTVNFHISQQIQQGLGSLDESGVAKAIAEVYKIAGTGADIDLEKLGRAPVAAMGRMMGFTRAIGSMDQDTILGLDQFLLEGKLNKHDAELTIREMIAGMEDALKGVSDGRFSAIRDRAEVEAELTKFKTALNDGDDAIRKALSDSIALNKNHKFATLSKLNAIAETTDLNLGIIAKGGYGRMASNPILATVRTSLEEDTLADFIVKKHADSLAEANALTAKMMKELSDPDIANHAARMMAIGEEIFADIDRAAQLRGVTRRGLFDALDQQGAKLGFDVASLRYVASAVGVDEMSTKAHQLHREMMANRQLRRINYYTSMDQSNANNIFMGSLQGDPEFYQYNDDILRSQAREALDSTYDTTERNILKVLADQSEEISDPAELRFANLQADIIRSRIEQAKLQAEGFRDAGAGTDITADEMRNLLDTEGAVDSVDNIAGTADDTRVTRDMLRSITPDDEGNLPSIFNKANYKRFSKDMFKDGGDLADLVTNPLVRKGAAGLGALVVGSFAYSAFKDRSNDDVEGPPLLPGGSAYEGNFPSRAPEIGDFAGQGYSPGVNYKVSLYGNRKAVQQFTNEAGGLVNGNIDTTMYNRISSMKQDPYSALASSY